METTMEETQRIDSRVVLLAGEEIMQNDETHNEKQITADPSTSSLVNEHGSDSSRGLGKQKLKLDDATVTGEIEEEVSSNGSFTPNSNKNSRANSSELIISETFVRIISKAVTHRVKIMQVVACYFDDMIENENSMTKSLSKLGGQYNSNLGMRIDWFQSVLSLMDDLVQKTMILSTAKHHHSFSQQITTHGSKLFREVYKSYPQNIQQKLNYCLSLIDELKRAKNAHQKNLDKYAKLIRDTETQLKARDNIIAANAILNNEGPSNDNENNNDTSSTLSSGATSTSTFTSTASTGSTFTTSSSSSTSSSTGSAVKEDRFMGRSFSKMLSKMSGNNNATSHNTASAQNPAEKKIEERCRELFKEIDIAERQLSANAESLLHYRDELLNTARRSIQELFETELRRLSAFKDGLSSFATHYEQVFSSLFDAFSLVSSQFSNVLTEPELPPLMNYLRMNLDSSPPALNFITSTPEITDNFTTERSEMTSFYLKLGRLADAYEIIIALTQRASSLMSEANDVDTNYSKNLQTIFDKNGFQKQPSDGNYYSSQSKYNIVNTGNNNCGQLLSSMELPGMKKAFESLLLTLSRLNDVTTKTSDSFSEEVLPQCSRIARSLSIAKKEVQDKTAAMIKRLDNNFQTLSKQRGELKKLKLLLRERRQTVKAARDEVGASGGDAGRDSITAATNTSFSDHRHSDTSEALKLSATSSSLTGAESAVSSENIIAQSEEMMIGGDETNTGRRQSSILGTTLNTVKLKQAVGFESASDRLSRIETQIANLEEKEVELTARCDQLYKALLNDLTVTRSELESTFTTYSDLLANMMRDLKGVIDLTSKLEVARYQSSRDLVKGLRETITVKLTLQDDIVIAKKVYASHALNSASNDTGENLTSLTSPKDGNTLAADLLEIPSVEAFKPIINPAVVEGKMKILHNSHQNPALLAAVAELKLQKEKEKEKEKAITLSAPEPSTNTATTATVISTGNDANTPPSGISEIAAPENTRRPSSPPPTITEINPSTPIASPEKTTPPLPPQPTTPLSPEIRTRKGSDGSNKYNNRDEGDINDFDPGDIFSFVDAATNSKQFTNSTTKKSSSARNNSSSSANNSNNNASSSLSGHGRTNSNSALVDVQDSEGELKKFGLTIYDKVLESFSCALYPKKGILTHGRLYITQHYVAFSGWPDTRVLLSMKRIDNIVRSNTLMYIPNAVTITMQDKSEYFFASFIDRDLCYQLLTNLMQVERRICELAGPDGVPDPPHLIFGYQHRSTILSSTKDAGIAGTGDDDEAGDGLARSDEEGEGVDRDDDGELDEEKQAPDNSFLTIPGSPDTRSTPTTVPPITPALPNKNNSAVTMTATPAPTPAAALPAPIQIVPVVIPRKKNPNPAPKLDTIYKGGNITQIAKKTIKGTTADIWKHFWRKATGYRDFLQSTGDVTKSFSDWKLGNGGTANPITVTEDLAKTKFQYERDFDYDHARTTMLMFGPKMAPTKLKQFISLHCEEEMEEEEWKTLHDDLQPKCLTVLCLSFCEGVPMADVFKVLQYWTFQTSPDNTSCEITIGFGIHYLKQSFFKSQISSGAKDEMAKQIEDFLKYLPNLLAKQRAALATANAVSSASGGVVMNSSDQLVADALLPGVLDGDGNNIVIITTGDDNGGTPQHKRQSRRLSLGNKSVTITTESTEEVPQTLMDKIEAWSWQGIDVKTLLFLFLVLLIVLQMRMIRNLSYEVKEMKSLLQQQFLPK